MMDADLDRQLETAVAQLVDSGLYASRNEVLREGVRLVQERDSRLATLDAAIGRGLADANAGRTRDADPVFDRLESKYRGMFPDAG